MAKNSFKMLKRVREKKIGRLRTTEEKEPIEPIVIADDIPIMIDDVKTIDHFTMTRVSYFTVECDTPSLNWFLELEERTIPFCLLGLSGIIIQPMGDNLIFDSTALIDDLFDQIEEYPPLYVDTDDLWLPNFLFRGPHERGQVYRIGIKLFNEAYRFKNNQISDDRFLSVCKELMEFIHHSKKETEAFKAWEEDQIKKAIDLYPKSPDLALEWHE